MMQAFGAVLKVLDVRAGQSVLEYGPGDGQISLALARMGCRVTAVDIEGRGTLSRSFRRRQRLGQASAHYRAASGKLSREFYTTEYCLF